MKETSENADDSKNNLFAESGGLGKYDTVKGSNAVQEQKIKYFKPWNSEDNDANWCGFCDKASVLSCLYTYPKYDVVWGNVTFTPRDIEQLMIIACENSINLWQSDFHGERYNGFQSDVQEEPLPTQLLIILKTLCWENTPFVMDIDKSSAVWNYPFDSVQVYVSIDPLDSVTETNNEEGKVYYTFHIKSKGYPDCNQTLNGWVDVTTGKEGWFGDWHPDFLWRKYKKSGKWYGKCITNNEIDAADVYYLYMKSLSSE